MIVSPDSGGTQLKTGIRGSGRFIPPVRRALSAVAKNGRRLSQGSGRPLTDMKYPSLVSIRTPTACRLFLIIARERCNERTTKPPLCYHSDGGKSWAKSLWRWNCFQLFPIHSVASSECRWVALGLFGVAAYWAVRGSLSFSISEDGRHGYSGQRSAVVVPCAIKYISILPLQVQDENPLVVFVVIVFGSIHLFS